MSETRDRFTKDPADLSRPEGRDAPLRRSEALQLLREHAPEIERRTGIRPVALFGSVARDEARTDSDVDVLVEYVRPVGWTELARAEVYLEALFEARVDLMTWDELKPLVRRYVEPELIRVA
jgi:uncharacterized protein